jgi:hypothetical protein
MRIFLAQLFKLYTFFLVAIATVVLGASLVPRRGSHGTLVCSQQNALIKRADIPFEERCPEEYPTYVTSQCSTDEPNVMLIVCVRDDGDVPFDTDYTCADDEICIDRTEFPDTPHAFCIKKKCGVPFDNSKTPDKDSCVGHSYSVFQPVSLVVSIMTYATNMNPIQVNNLYMSYKDNLSYSKKSVNNYTMVIDSYNGENIDFCFDDGATGQKVQAYAAAWLTPDL